MSSKSPLSADRTSETDQIGIGICGRRLHLKTVQGAENAEPDGTVSTFATKCTKGAGVNGKVSTTVSGFEEGAEGEEYVSTTPDALEEAAEVYGEVAAYERVIGGAQPKPVLQGISNKISSSTEPLSEVEDLCKNKNSISKIMIKLEAVSRPNKIP
ncbi:hypothetical protein BDD12DRAFT_887430 [Trichophaea hybrida]|nr:hypothetical protein BDD12DRAFT_887430 [Trichophaea hybrida]